MPQVGDWATAKVLETPLAARFGNNKSWSWRHAQSEKNDPIKNGLKQESARMYSPRVAALSDVYVVGVGD